MHISITREGEKLFDSFSTGKMTVVPDRGVAHLLFDRMTSNLVETGVCELDLRLDRDEFVRVGRLHRASVSADLVEVAELISSGASLRRVKERVDHWRRYWNLTEYEVLGFLQRVESPLEVLKRELSLVTASKPVVFGFSEARKLPK